MNKNATGQGDPGNGSPCVHTVPNPAEPGDRPWKLGERSEEILMIEPQMKNPYTYCFTTEVPYYQCDLSGKMKLSWLLKVMERAAGEHLEHL